MARRLPPTRRLLGLDAASGISGVSCAIFLRLAPHALLEFARSLLTRGARQCLQELRSRLRWIRSEAGQQTVEPLTPNPLFECYQQQRALLIQHHIAAPSGT